MVSIDRSPVPKRNQPKSFSHIYWIIAGTSFNGIWVAFISLINLIKIINVRNILTLISLYESNNFNVNLGLINIYMIKGGYFHSILLVWRIINWKGTESIWTPTSNNNNKIICWLFVKYIYVVNTKNTFVSVKEYKENL